MSGGAALVRHDELQRLWRLLPQPWRARMGPAISQVLLDMFGRSLARRWRLAPTPGDGVSIVGFFTSSIGLGRGARLQADALEAFGLDVERVDVSDYLQRSGWSGGGAPPAPSPGRTVISHLNPPELIRYLGLIGARGYDRRHIGYWAWELPEAPAGWRRAALLVDEVWAPSRHTAQALRRITPPGKVIRVAPHPLHLTPCEAERPADLPLDPGAFVVLSAIDLRSTLARKNFQGVLAVAARCAAIHGSSVRFVLKLSGVDQEAQAAEIVRRDLAAQPDIVVIDQDVDQGAMTALVLRADAVMSLHRAEGFGLLLAEAMQAGKPVIATGWSGNLEFMSPADSILLPYRLVPVRDRQGRYRGSHWAEPDLDAAVDAVGRLAGDRVAAARLGAAAPAALRRALGGDAWIEPFIGAVDERALRRRRSSRQAGPFSA